MHADHEGKGYAEFLSKNGIAAFVLDYRLAQYGYQDPAMRLDVQRAIRTVRALGKYGKVGVMGSSAGGHLAATALTQFDRSVSRFDAVDDQSARPDFGVLCYPVISMEEFAHEGSRDNLLGIAHRPEDRRLHSHNRNVTPRTPPTFLWHTAEDEPVPPENSLLMAGALSAEKVPFELHIYQRGAHGIGLGPKADHPWGCALLQWLNQLD